MLKTGKMFSNFVNAKFIIHSLCFVAIISIYPITITLFAYGISDFMEIYLILYPSLIIATILIFCKIRFGFYITLLVSFTYSLFLLDDVGKYLIFDLNNYTLFWILMFPFLIFLLLIPLISIYLSRNRKNAKTIKVVSIILTLGIIIFTIMSRYNKNYDDDIFIESKINEKGRILLNCSPHFGDSRKFVITTDNKRFIIYIKKYSEFKQGDFLFNATIEKNYNFGSLKSIKITKINNYEIYPKLTWNFKEIQGNYEFLSP